MGSKTPKIVGEDTSAEVTAFLDKLAITPAPQKEGQRGRLIFALDATMSRQPTWDAACHLQAGMFAEADRIGGLDVKLIYFRGYRECKASKWHGEAAPLQAAMAKIQCMGGYTQIGRVLKRAIKEAKDGPIGALVYVGDAMEEDVDDLCHHAGKLGVMGVPAFFFQEGDDPAARGAFKEMARLTGGAWCRFDASSASQLRDLLQAVAVYAAGGRKALLEFGGKRGGQAQQLIESMNK
jgi:hypothetical protein